MDEEEQDLGDALLRATLSGDAETATVLLQDDRLQREHIVKPYSSDNTEGEPHSVLHVLCTSRACPGLDHGMDTVRRLASLLDVRDILSGPPTQGIFWTSYLMSAIVRKRTSLSVALAERCIAVQSPQFTAKLHMKLVASAYNAENMELFHLLADSLGPCHLLEELYTTNSMFTLELSLRTNSRRFLELADKLNVRSVTGSNNGKGTLLHSTASTGRWECMDYLLDRTPQLAAVANREGCLAIHLVHFSPPPLDVFKKLLHGTPVEVLMGSNGKHGCGTILHVAARRYSPAHVMAILERVPDIRNVKDARQEAPLDLAEQRAAGLFSGSLSPQSRERLEEDGRHIVELLSVGRATKRASSGS